MEDQLARLSGCNYFTVLDLASGYYQITMSAESIPRTAFVTPDGHFEFLRMPFGLTNAPAVCQKMMNAIAREVNDNVIVYLDDIIIPSTTIQEGMEKLERLLKVLQQRGLTLKLKKCQFFKEKVEFLGHEIDSHGIRPGSNKTNAILTFPTPTDKHEVRQFIGLASYFRKFVKNFSIIAEPLTRLTKTNESFNWTNEQTTSFELLKSKLGSRDILMLYNPELEHEVCTDASSKGLAGILFQRDEKGETKPVSYFSRRTTDNECKYHSYELEALAVVEALHRFRIYLIGKPFTLVTDCAALTTCATKKDLIPRIGRWWLRLAEYSFNTVHRSGQKMQHVDALSRNTIDDGMDLEPATIDVFLVSQQDDWLIGMQRLDDDIQKIIEVMSRKDYTVYKEQLYRIVHDKRMWVVPRTLKWRIAKMNHDDMGHPGVEKTVEVIRRHFWFSRIRDYVKKYISSCLECGYTKSKGGTREGEMYPIDKTPIPFHTIHVDHLGPFPKTSKGNAHLIVIIDAFSKYVVIKAAKSTNTAPVISVMDDWTTHFGVPTRLISDRGTTFTARSFETYCSENNIKHILNATATPRANGQCERYNRTILGMLRAMVGEDDRKWDTNIRNIQWALNTMINDTTKLSPQRLILTYEPRSILKNKLLLSMENNKFTDDDVETITKLAYERTKAAGIRQKQRFDKAHYAPHKYNEGDMVFVKWEGGAPSGTSRKLIPKYRGPYLIDKALGHDRYHIVDVPGAEQTQRKFDGVCSSDRLKPWCTLEDLEEVGNIDDSDEDIFGCRMDD